MKLAKLSVDSMQCQCDKPFFHTFNSISFSTSSPFSSRFSLLENFFTLRKMKKKKWNHSWFMFHQCLLYSVSLRACFLISQLMICGWIVQFDSKMFCDYWAFCLHGTHSLRFTRSLSLSRRVQVVANSVNWTTNTTNNYFSACIRFNGFSIYR